MLPRVSLNLRLWESEFAAIVTKHQVHTTHDCVYAVCSYLHPQIKQIRETDVNLNDMQQHALPLTKRCVRCCVDQSDRLHGSVSFTSSSYFTTVV